MFSEGRPGVFACTVNVVPGTHHIRFLVDGNMCTSPDLPTTVDFGNNLVNYIEVSADDLPENSAEGGAAGVAAAAAGGSLTAQEAQRRMSTAKLAGGGTAFTAPGAAKGPAQDKAQAEAEAPESAKAQPAARSRPVENLDKYSSKIPHYLADFDQPEDSPPYQFAISAIERLPPPPGLPGFLSKPILNLPILMKEDNSVLIMPNHTTLNHLATSSIKNNVLAVSATTRYRSKVSPSFLASRAWPGRE